MTRPSASGPFEECQLANSLHNNLGLEILSIKKREPHQRGLLYLKKGGQSVTNRDNTT